MPNYKQKLTNPMTDEDFINDMEVGRFLKVPEHKGFCAFLYYTAARVSEALKMKAGQFRRTPNTLYIEIERLKHSRETPPLEIPLDTAFTDCIVDSYLRVDREKRVWPYCRKTGYNIVKRVFPTAYPHYFRLSRITRFFAEGFTIAQVRSWTGLTLKALDYYVGLVGISEMGRALKSERKS